MEVLTLKRHLKNRYETRGSLTDETGKVIAYTIEPPTAQFAQDSESAALPEGTYNLDVRMNPFTGTPTIKILGRDSPQHAALRACKPVSASNPSITLVSEETALGDSKTIDLHPWLTVLKSITPDSQLIIE